MAQPQASPRARPAADPTPARRASRPGWTAAAERRRRARHYRLLRRDLVEDLGAGLLLSVLLFLFTAGLGVLALIEIPLVGALIAAGVIDRRRRRQRAQRIAADRRRRHRAGSR
jgi:hypothetical protein